VEELLLPDMVPQIRSSRTQIEEKTLLEQKGGRRSFSSETKPFPQCAHCGLAVGWAAHGPNIPSAYKIKQKYYNY